MSDRADTSAHPDGAAIAQPVVSDHESDTDPVTPYAEFHRVMRGPSFGTGPLDLAFTVAAPVAGVPKGSPIDSHFDPAVLMARAEAIGGGQASAAVCGAVRPELLIIDVDGCLDQVKTQVIAAAADTGAVYGYETASGSPNSGHLGFAVTPTIRAAAATAIDAVRVAHGLTKTDVDIRKPTHHLRFPGSASLKGSGRCVPVTIDGTPMTAIAAANRLKAALAAVDDGALDLEVTPAAPRPRSVASPPPTARPAAIFADDDGDISRWELEPERAWRAPTPITQDGFKVLDQSVDPKLRARVMRSRTSGYKLSAADKARWDKENGSQLATNGAWVLWRAGIRSWSVARHYYRRHACFTKYAARDAEARAAGKKPVHCFQEWQKVKERAQSYRPALPVDEATFIDRVLVEVAQWDDADAVAGAAHAIHEVFADGRGAFIARPLAERTVAMWLSVSPTTARTRLNTLVERGLLTLEVPHDRHTARHEAHCYRLHLPSPKYRTKSVHDVTRGGTYTHALWGDLGQDTRHVYEKLGTERVPTAVLATATSQNPGSRTHGVLRQLRALESVGLAVRHGSGNTTTWSRGSASLGEAAERVGSFDRHRLLVAAINVERKAWHATSHRTSASARKRLLYLHRRQHVAASQSSVTEAVNGARQLQLVDRSAVESDWRHPRLEAVLAYSGESSRAQVSGTEIPSPRRVRATDRGS